MAMSVGTKVAILSLQNLSKPELEALLKFIESKLISESREALDAMSDKVKQILDSIGSTPATELPMITQAIKKRLLDGGQPPAGVAVLPDGTDPTLSGSAAKKMEESC